MMTAVLILETLTLLCILACFFMIRRIGANSKRDLKEIKKYCQIIVDSNNPEKNSAKNLVSRLAEIQNAKFATGNRR